MMELRCNPINAKYCLHIRAIAAGLRTRMFAASKSGNYSVYVP